MAVPRFYCPELRVGRVKLPEAEAQHAVRSRRLRTGDQIELFDGQGSLAYATLAAGSGSGARSGRLRCDSVAAEVRLVEHFALPRRSLTLVVAACKGRRLDFLVEKCTELGVACLIFAEFARSVVHLDSAGGKALERTAIEACKQSGRLWLPTIQTGTRLCDVVRSTAAAAGSSPARTITAGPQQELLVADPAPDAPLVGQYLSRRPAAEQVTAVVGPEGGLTTEELAYLEAAGGVRVRLGAHILRVETAAAAIAAAWAGWVEQG